MFSFWPHPIFVIIYDESNSNPIQLYFGFDDLNSVVISPSNAFNTSSDDESEIAVYNDSPLHSSSDDAYKANAYANMLGPIIHNIGNILYVLVAILGVIFVTLNVKTPSITLFKFANVKFTFKFQADYDLLSIGVAVAFLGMARQFANSFNQISMQLNSAVMGLAGADRVFELMDQDKEEDQGYVTLVNANIDEQGNITETTEHTGHWAWKHPHQADGTVTYTELKGDIRFFDVDFGYFPEKIVLHDVSVYAKPGQKIAFVGATGAGKTTITNLLNRFYDYNDGHIYLD
jgi:ATP-binding cassette subfamily B protein